MHGSQFGRRDRRIMPAPSVGMSRARPDRTRDMRMVAEECPVALVYDGTTIAAVTSRGRISIYLFPLTGQPDFAHLLIDYVPSEWIVESKSFKLFLSSYRNHGAFHEACTMEISTRLISLLDPVWLRIGAYWYPRGGIPIDVFWQSGQPPADAWVPSQDVPHYRGRG